jgi:CO/xanthine dehydrogenase FAD-binding subunit
MKPAPFQYVRPKTLKEASAILAADDEARIIAGGQTLVPMLAMRLARPTVLVDILRLPELAGIRRDDGALVVGATVRQAEAEGSPLIARDAPLLAAALPWVGHPPTRNRGTIGGSLANADPSAEIPLIAVTLGAEILVEDESGPAALSADDFFIGPMITAMPPAGCLTAVRLPVWSDRRIGVAFHEISARRSDFAFVAAAAQVALEEDGGLAKIALGVGGADDRPVKLDMSSLIGTEPDAGAIAELAQEAAATLDAASDLHASAAYRRRAAAVLAARALGDAIANAKERGA